MHLDRTPAYRQIADYYATLIRDGRIRPGEQLPTLAQIRATWDVADGTARAAIQFLKREGLVDASRKGVFVHHP